MDEISEARAKLDREDAETALASWKQLPPGQRKRWLEIVAASSH